MYKPILECAHLCERRTGGKNLSITPTSTITLSSSCTAVAPLTCGASSGFAAVGGRPVHWNAPLFTDCKATLGTLTSSATACRKVVAFSVQCSAFSVQRSAFRVQCVVCSMQYAVCVSGVSGVRSQRQTR